MGLAIHSRAEWAAVRFVVGLATSLAAAASLTTDTEGSGISYKGVSL